VGYEAEHFAMLEGTIVEASVVRKVIIKMAENNDPQIMDDGLAYLDEYCPKSEIRQSAMQIAKLLPDDIGFEFVARVYECKREEDATAVTEPTTPEKLGEIVGAPESALLELGRQICKNPQAAKFKSANTRAALERFNAEAADASGRQSRVMLPSDGQVSKLHVFARVVQTHGNDAALNLVDATIKIYREQIFASDRYKKMDVEGGEYNSLIRVLRRAIRWKRIPTKAETFKIMIGEM